MKRAKLYLFLGMFQVAFIPVAFAAMFFLLAYCFRYIVATPNFWHNITGSIVFFLAFLCILTIVFGVLTIVYLAQFNKNIKEIWRVYREKRDGNIDSKEVA